MTQEEEQLLLKDICARIPYGLFCQTDDGKGKLISVECSFGDDLVYVDFGYPEAKEYDLNDGGFVKPYLRPMSSMTEEEEREFEETLQYTQYTLESYDWLNVHRFDYRGLIEKGLAHEAPEDMYKTE